jgi:hypothetical protein
MRGQCLHRFCDGCIQQALRLAKKECPSCRIHVPSRRSLRADATMDDLVRTFYPSQAKLEEMEVRARSLCVCVCVCACLCVHLCVYACTCVRLSVRACVGGGCFCCV